MKPPNISDDFIKNNNYFLVLSPIMIRFRLRSARWRWFMTIMMRSRLMLRWSRLWLMMMRRFWFRRMYRFRMIVMVRRWWYWSIVSIISVIHHICSILMDHFIQWIKQDRARVAQDTCQEYKQCLFHN